MATYNRQESKAQTSSLHHCYPNQLKPGRSLIRPRKAHGYPTRGLSFQGDVIVWEINPSVLDKLWDGNDFPFGKETYCSRIGSSHVVGKLEVSLSVM
jgi:hypothetical protein